MEIQIFKVFCKNKDCGYEFITSSDKHTHCPNCKEKDIEYNEGMAFNNPYNAHQLNVESLIEDKATALTAVLIASSYISGDDIIARYDDNKGFKLNLKSSKFIDDIIRMLDLTSESDLLDMISDEIEDTHASLIYEPKFACIKRYHYYDEDGDLHESGFVKYSISKEFYIWITNNLEKVKNILLDIEADM